jgi:transcription factor S
MKHRMEFCKECGSRLKPVKTHSGNQSMVLLTCTKCGAKKQEPEPLAKVLTPKVIQHDPKQMVAVIDRELDLNPMPTIHMDCPRCGNNTANVWLVQTRGSDESSTQFIRCVECGYTFRENT